MNQTIANTLHDYYLTTAIPFLIIDRSGNEEIAFPEEFLSFYKKELYHILLQALATCPHPEGTLLYQLEDVYYCAITKLDASCYLVSAPVSSSTFGSDTMFSSLIRLINTSRIPDLRALLPHIAVLSTYRLSKFMNIGRLLYGASPADGISIKQSTAAQSESKTNSDAAADTVVKEHPVDHIEDFQTLQIHHSIYYPERMEKAIIKGDAKAFQQEHKKPMIGSYGQMSLNPLRQSKYIFMCAISTISRAAVQGGVPVEIALQQSDMYCQRMDAMTSIQEIEDLILAAGTHYCKMVQQYSFQHNYSPYTKIVLAYIRRHLFEPIRMEHLSFEAGLNRRSLSIYFQQDTGLSISEYVTNQRLEEAKTLLSTTNLSIVQISELLCFSSQSYFGKKYKAYYGITPKEYRDSLSV